MSQRVRNLPAKRIGKTQDAHYDAHRRKAAAHSTQSPPHTFKESAGHHKTAIQPTRRSRL